MGTETAAPLAPDASNIDWGAPVVEPQTNAAPSDTNVDWIAPEADHPATAKREAGIVGRSLITGIAGIPEGLSQLAHPLQTAVIAGNAIGHKLRRAFNWDTGPEEIEPEPFKPPATADIVQHPEMWPEAAGKLADKLLGTPTPEGTGERILSAAGEGGVQSVLGNPEALAGSIPSILGSATRAGVMGGAAGAAQQGAVEAGVPAEATMPLGLAAGAAAGHALSQGQRLLPRPSGRGAGSAAWTPADQAQIPRDPKFSPEGAIDAEFTPMDEPSAGAAAKAAPKALPAPAAAEPAEPVTPAKATVDHFHLANPEPAAVGFAGKRVNGNARVDIATDPFDPNVVHLEALEADTKGLGHGPAALEHVIDIADEHGATVKLDAVPMGKGGPNAQKLMDIYRAAGFVEDPNGAGKTSMIRVPGGAPAEPAIPTKNVSIISAERGERTPEENAQHTEQLRKQLAAAGLKPVATSGVYQNGAPEPGFAVATASHAAQKIVDELGKKHDQESVLHVDAKGEGSFRYGDGRPDESIGTFTPVARAEARGAVGYTRDANGQHYTLKAPEVAKAAEGVPNQPAEPAATPKFEAPSEEGEATAPRQPDKQAETRAVLRRIGLQEARGSAISGDYRETGFDHETGKLDNAAGNRMAAVIKNEQTALREHAQRMLERTGAPRRVTDTDRGEGGRILAAPIEGPDGGEQHLEARKQVIYDRATERAKGQPIIMNGLNDTITNNKAAFHSTVAGKQLLEGVKMRAGELGLLGPNDVFNPATVEQAEKLRQYVVDAYTHDNSRQAIALKNVIDADVAHAAGEDTYKLGRKLHATQVATFDEPKGIQALRSPPVKNNRMQLNRPVPYEGIGSHVMQLPLDQFNHVIDVYNEVSHWSPELQAKAIAAKNELQGQIMNDVLRIGSSNQDGMWNVKGVQQYLDSNAGKIARIAKPELVQDLKDLNDAGRALKMDRVYKGAAAQKHNMVMAGVISGLEHATGVTTLGGVAGGSHIPGGHLAGAVVGAAVGSGMKKLGGVIGDASLKSAVNKRIVDLTQPEPEPPKSKIKVPPGQAGRVGGNVKAQPNPGMKSKQRGVGVKAPIPEEISNHLTPQERTQLRADTTERMISAFHALPDTHELAAAALAGGAKKGWYKQSAEAITNVFGGDAPRFAAVLAALSPQTSVQANFHNAVRTFVNWDAAGRPTNPDAIKRIMTDSVQKQEGGVGLLHAWVPNTIRALTHQDPELQDFQLSGPKVNSFMHNLRKNVNEVTLDAWMSTFAKIDPSKLAGSGNKSGPGKSPTYLAYNAKVRQAASMLTHLTGEKWSPAEVQETVWSWAKTAFEHASSEGKKVPDVVNNGEITDDLIKSTPDFHQLFSSPEHAGFIAGSRYGKAADAVDGGKSKGSEPTHNGQKSEAAKVALRPHLERAAHRLGQTLEERRASGDEAPF